MRSILHIIQCGKCCWWMRRERERSSNKGREAWQYCMEHGGQAADVGEKVVGMIDMHAIARIDEST